MKKPRIQRMQEKLLTFGAEISPDAWVQTLLGLGTAVVLGSIFFFSMGRSLFAYEGFEEGNRAPRKVRASQSYSLTDDLATRSSRARAEAKVPRIYKLDLSEGSRVMTRAKKLLGRHESYINMAEIKKPAALETMIKEFELVLDAESREALQKADPVLLRTHGIRALRELYNHILADESFSNSKRAPGVKVFVKDKVVEVDRYVAPREVESLFRKILRGHKTRILAGDRDLLVQLLLPLVNANLLYQEAATKEAIDIAREGVEPVLLRVSRRETIVEQGQIVDRKTRLKLDAITTQKRRIDSWAALLLAGGIVGLIAIGFGAVRGKHGGRTKHLSVALLVLVVHSVMAWVLTTSVALPGNVGGYLIPTASSAIVLGLLLRPPIAWSGALAASCVAGALGGMQFQVFLVSLAGSVAGLLMLRRATQRWDLVRAGLWICVFQALAVGTVEVFQAGFLGSEIRGELVSDMIKAGGAGLMSALLAMGLLPLFETIFEITTDIKLLELSDLNQPLLRQLTLQAPGTYHHSLMVGNLAEAGAEKIGANPLLARVGSYYHDIGKITKPLYFIENQADQKNRHDNLAPTMSSLIILNHTKEGLDMARDHRLPQEIQDMIGQHHGTTTVASFHQKALDAAGDKPVQDDNFRYPGPKPQSKEAALIMLADAVESAARSLKEPSHGRFEDLVHRIINKRFIEGQLNECDLTLQDLNQIAKVFVRTLVSIHHSRIQYPEDNSGAPSVVGQSSLAQSKGRQLRSAGSGNPTA